LMHRKNCFRSLNWQDFRACLIAVHSARSGIMQRNAYCWILVKY
jgi:hypothetical protein